MSKIILRCNIVSWALRFWRKWTELDNFHIPISWFLIKAQRRCDQFLWLLSASPGLSGEVLTRLCWLLSLAAWASMQPPAQQHYTQYKPGWEGAECCKGAANCRVSIIPTELSPGAAGCRVNFPPSMLTLTLSSLFPLITWASLILRLHNLSSSNLSH